MGPSRPQNVKREELNSNEKRPGFPRGVLCLGWPRHGSKSRVVGRGVAAPAGGLRALVRLQSIFGSVSNWWYGGGEEIVHSSVVAPSPHGLSPAGLPAIIDQIRLTKNTTMPAAMIM